MSTFTPALRRQLLDRSAHDILETVEALGGMNAQTGRGPGVGLYARIDGFRHQVPDETAWRPGRTRYVLAETVLEGPLGEPDAGLADLLTTYLRTHGPATAADATYFTGLTELHTPLKEVGTAVGGSARTPLLDLPDRPEAEPPKVVVLPEYDSVWFGHKDGACKDTRKRLIPNTAVDMHGSVLVDGELVGAWKPRRDAVELVDQLPKAAARTFDGFRDWYALTCEETDR